MSYNYETQKPRLFTDQGQRDFLKARDEVHRLLGLAGAFRFDKVNFGSGDSWTMLAMIDRMIELGEIEECPRPSWAQYKVYSTPQRHNA